MLSSGPQNSAFTEMITTIMTADGQQHPGQICSSPAGSGDVGADPGQGVLVIVDA